MWSTPRVSTKTVIFLTIHELYIERELLGIMLLDHLRMIPLHCQVDQI